MDTLSFLFVSVIAITLIGYGIFVFKSGSVNIPTNPRPQHPARRPASLEHQHQASTPPTPVSRPQYIFTALPPQNQG